MRDQRRDHCRCSHPCYWQTCLCKKVVNHQSYRSSFKVVAEEPKINSCTPFGLSRVLVFQIRHVGDIVWTARPVRLDAPTPRFVVRANGAGPTLVSIVLLSLIAAPSRKMSLLRTSDGSGLVAVVYLQVIPHVIRRCRFADSQGVSALYPCES
jgi:hypothetical protein